MQKDSEKTVAISQLTDIIQAMEDNFENLSERRIEELDESKYDLKQLLEEKARGVIFRSRATWCMEAEINTKYFYSMEKSRANSKTCMALVMENGDEITDQWEILSEQRKFYEELYTSDKNVKFDLDHNDINAPRIPDPSKACDGVQFSEQEVYLAAKSLKNGKTPGSDGLPIDFYKVFWLKIKGPLYEMMKETYAEAELSESAKCGILNLIPKPHKDTRLLKNLRPITLLNSDYKIIEKCVANRMLSAMDFIINNDQRGFLPNRRIAVGIRKIYDAIIDANEHCKKGIILNLDFSKAFDKLEMVAIKGSMKLFGFADILVEWIDILYRHFYIYVQNSGFFSDQIRVTRSVHQGAPASSLIFVVVAETLALQLRGNANIKGYYIKEIIDFLNQYADDANISLDADPGSLEEVFKTLDEFRMQSGLQISYDKTTLHRIGSLKQSDANTTLLGKLTGVKMH